VQHQLLKQSKKTYRIHTVKYLTVIYNLIGFDSYNNG